MVPAARLRYGGEWLDLFIAALVTFIVLAILGVATSGAVCLWAFIGIVIVLGITTISTRSTLKRAERIDADSWPRLYGIGKLAGERLGVSANNLYIDGSGEVNAFAMGIFSPGIVLHRGLVDIMDDDELAFVIGHEMGHVKLHHTSLKTILETGMARVPLLVYLPLLAFRLLFLRGRMSRSMELSADRAGLYASRDIEAAVRCLLKLHSGEASIPDRLVREAMGVSPPSTGVSLGSFLSTHPDRMKRIRALVDHSRSSGVGWKAT